MIVPNLFRNICLHKRKAFILFRNIFHLRPHHLIGRRIRLDESATKEATFWEYFIFSTLLLLHKIEGLNKESTDRTRVQLSVDRTVDDSFSWTHKQQKPIPIIESTSITANTQIGTIFLFSRILVFYLILYLVKMNNWAVLDNKLLQMKFWAQFQMTSKKSLPTKKFRSSFWYEKVAIRTKLGGRAEQLPNSKIVYFIWYEVDMNHIQRPSCLGSKLSTVQFLSDFKTIKTALCPRFNPTSKMMSFRFFFEVK